MNDNLEKLLRDAKHIKLSETEKALVKERVLARMKDVSNITSSRLIKVEVLSWSQKLRLLLPINYTYMPLALIAVLFVGGGVSFAAQGSIPGDFLYPVKVGVTEKIEGALSLSSEAKANLEVRLAERRLEEAEKIASKNKLEADVEASLQERFELHASRVEARIESLSQNNVVAALDVASRFEASLKAHDAILSRSQVSNDARMAKVEMATFSLMAVSADVAVDSGIKGSVRSSLDRASEVRANLESSMIKANVESKTAVEGKMKAAENKISQVKVFVEKQSARINTQTKVEAEAVIAVAEQVFAQAKIAYEAENYNEAFVLFQKALREAQEVHTILGASLDVNIDLPVNINTEVRGNSQNVNNGNSVRTEAQIEVNSSDKGTSSETNVNIEAGLQLGL